MRQLFLALLNGKKRKYAALMAGIMFCFFFVMAVDTMYQGYCGAQIANAYSYSGEWDICVRIPGSNREISVVDEEELEISAIYSTTYCLRLDPVSEELLTGGFEEYVTDYYLALYEMLPDGQNVLPYRLTEGRYPETEHEIVIPENMQYQGLDAKKGTIQIGDRLTFTYGRRKNSMGLYTQGEVTDRELFEVCGEREYTICGFIEFPDYRTDHFVLYGYAGISEQELNNAEELTVYYRIKEPSAEKLRALVNEFGRTNGVISVSGNEHLEIALEVIENSDYMHSLRLGLYLFEGILVLVGLCIAGANQYQSIVEDRKQIARLYSFGATKGNLCALYCATNLVTVLVGGGLSFVLYGAFLEIVRRGMLAGLRNSMFRIDIYSLDYKFLFFAFGLFAITLMVIVCRLVLAQIPARKEKIRKAKNKKQSDIRSMAGLAVENHYAMRVKSRIQTTILCVVLIAMPIFLCVFMSAYYTAERVAGEWSADYYCHHRGFQSDLPGVAAELQNNPYVKEFQWSSYGPKQAYFPGDCIPENVRKVLQTENHGGQFTEDNIYHEGIYLIFINEKYYNDMNKKNGGKLPSYEEFAGGDNCLVYSQCLIPQNGQSTFGDTEEPELTEQGMWYDVGEYIAAHTDTVSFHPYAENEEILNLHLIGSVSEYDSDDCSIGLNLCFLVPTHIYEDYCRGTSMYIGTHYTINGYGDSLTQLWESLKDMNKRYTLELQDNVSLGSVAKDAVAIQYVTSVSCIIVILILCISALGVMRKIDFVARRQTYDTYRVLGLERRYALMIQFTEQMMPFVNAMLISLLLHYGAGLTVFQDLYDYYGIELMNIGLFFICTCVGILIVLGISAVRITYKRYRRPITLRNRDIKTIA